MCEKRDEGEREGGGEVHSVEVSGSRSLRLARQPQPRLAFSFLQVLSPFTLFFRVFHFPNYYSSSQSQMGSSARASHLQEPPPSLSFRTGRSLTTFPFLSFQILLTLFLSSQTDGSVPNTLVIANCEVVKPRVAAAEHISQFNEEARSPFVKKHKTILHPGEVCMLLTCVVSRVLLSLF